MADELLLEIRGLHAWYAGAHILQGVDLELGAEATGVVGRNGMGKTTLCNAIMGLVGAVPGGRVEGSILLDGHELVGRSVHHIATAGIGYVPQGRRIFPSLNTHEHLRMLGRPRGPWTIDRVYELFPRLAERRRVGAAQLSGGEQQMLAVGRALLTNPKLLLMDEPSEGLAPTVVEGLVAATRRLVEEEGMRVLVVEQNLGVATALAQRLLVMLTGRIATETTADALLADSDAQQRFLGVTAQTPTPART